MTIRKGEPWGTVGRPEPGVATAASDAALRRLVERARAAGTPIPPVLLTGGDLWRAVGGGATDRTDQRADERVMLPIDVVRVETGGRTGWFTAHLVARRSWWRGDVAVALNSQYVGVWDVAPRAHPNDGRVDVVAVAAAMSVRDRIRARRRLVLGTHVPHPDIAVRQSTEYELTFDRPLPLWLDGQRWGSAASVQLVVEPDALTVFV